MGTGIMKWGSVDGSNTSQSYFFPCVNVISRRICRGVKQLHFDLSDMVGLISNLDMPKHFCSRSRNTDILHFFLKFCYNKT